VPHFEKLSDQALLARAYLRGARSMPEHARVARGRPGHDQLRLSDLAVESGFASALDADAGGLEVHRDLDPERSGRRARRGRAHDDLDAVRHDGESKEPADFEVVRFLDSRSTAVQHPRRARGRARVTAPFARPRIQPGRDEKVILEWNAMFASALSKFVTRLTPSAHSLCSSRFSELNFHDGVWWRTRVVGRTPVRATLPG